MSRAPRFAPATVVSSIETSQNAFFIHSFATRNMNLVLFGYIATAVHEAAAGAASRVFGFGSASASVCASTSASAFASASLCLCLDNGHKEGLMPVATVAGSKEYQRLNLQIKELRERLKPRREPIFAAIDGGHMPVVNSITTTASWVDRSNRRILVTPR